MDSSKDLYKLINKETLEETTRISSLDETFEDFWKVLNTRSEDELLPLALSLDEGIISATQEERENHFWVLGSTGEGKSKFLEHLIRFDVRRLLNDLRKPEEKRRACSLCFIDPTPQGKIARQVFNYCAQIGFKKVFLVDPYLTSHGKVPPINPLHYEETHIQSSVEYLLDAFRVLFEVEDQSRTAYITTYLRAVFTVLHFAELTATDLLYFSLPPDNTIVESAKHQRIREAILEKVEDRNVCFPPLSRQKIA